MADTSPPIPLDLEGQVACIPRAREGSETFVAERRGLMAETPKLDRDRVLAPRQFALSIMAPGAAFIELIGA